MLVWMEVTMNTKKQLIRKLYSPDNKVAIQALDNLREQGGLEQGALTHLCLKYVHLQRADLHKANLQATDLCMADLRWSNMSWANLREVNLTKANLYAANLDRAILDGANLIKVNLQCVRNLSDDQLRRTNCMRGAIMPDGSIYDGRFYLPGDLLAAQKIGVDLTVMDEFAAFYGVHIHRKAQISDDQVLRLKKYTDAQLVRLLRSSDHQVVIEAIYELRKRGQLSDGSLAWTHLKYVHLQDTDLSTANLSKADLQMANLHSANLSQANLEGTRFIKANLRGCNFDGANLRDSILTGANLQSACNLSYEQLSAVSSLRGATLPDGSRYDGRFNLTGDQWTAATWRVDLNDPEEAAEFYGVSLHDYLFGQGMEKDKVQATNFTLEVSGNWCSWSDMELHTSSGDVRHS